MITPRLRRGASLFLLTVMVALALAACGKKNSPRPPPGVPNTYPRTYPRE